MARAAKRLVASLSAAVVVALAVALLALEPTYAVVLGALLSGERALVLELPKPEELLGVTARAAGYYVEVWAVVPDGIVTVYNSTVDPGSPRVKLTAGELKRVVGAWLEHYRIHGKHWIPALVVQASVYSPEANLSVLAFGASVIYDPEFFVSPLPRAAVHRLEARTFPVIEKFDLSRLRARRGTPRATVSCALHGSCGSACQQGLGALSDISSYQVSYEAGLPGPCPPGPYSCDCCIADSRFPYFTRVRLNRLIFDSGDPNLPEHFRDVVPIVITYLDPLALSGPILARYEARNINGILFRMGILKMDTKVVIWGDPSGKLASSSIDVAISVSRRGAFSYVFWRGRFQLYEATGYTCCYARLCSGGWYMPGSVAVVCEPNGWGALVTIVNYVSSGIYGVFDIPRTEFPVSIDTFRSRLPFSSYTVPAGRYIEMREYPPTYRVNILGLITAAACAKLDLPWYACYLSDEVLANLGLELPPLRQS